MRLSKGERLWLSRRRQGMRAEDMARAFGVSPDLYTDLERDRRAVPAWIRVVPAGRLSDEERLALMRRREGMTTREAAACLEVSHSTYLGWEAGRGRVDRGLRWFAVRMKLSRFWAEVERNVSSSKRVGATSREDG